MKSLNYKNIAILGAGGHTRSSINLLKQKFTTSIFNIYDNNYTNTKNEFILGIKVSGSYSSIEKNQKVFLSIGNNNERLKLFKKYNKQIIEESLFHNNSFIEKNIIIGISNQIFANVYINSEVKIGDNNIINTGAILEHEVQIGNHNHISVGSKICGRVKIGNNCFIGAGSTIIDKISVCDNVIIGAGTIVIKNIDKPGTYIGNPAKQIK
jgi:sugar O-acyltransferase (sialic acid O-acetyltransferase NeuD family)